jgi:hypothetical protein
MAVQEVKLDWSDFERKLARRMSTATRSIYEVAAEQFKGIIKGVVGITPPMHDQGIGDGMTTVPQARAAGRTKVASDIAKLYGTPSEAAELIKDQAGPDQVKEFWALYKHQKFSQASEMLLPYASGAGLYAFDGGAVHRRFRNKRGSVNSRRKIYFVQDPDELRAYVAKKQENVFWLASGWKDICAKMGISLPAAISKHHAPGVGTIELTEDRIRFFAANDVGYGRAVDLERRVQFAVDAQSSKMQRQWETFMKTQFWQDAGFQMAA